MHGALFEDVGGGDECEEAFKLFQSLNTSRADLAKSEAADDIVEAAAPPPERPPQRGRPPKIPRPAPPVIPTAPPPTISMPSGPTPLQVLFSSATPEQKKILNCVLSNIENFKAFWLDQKPGTVATQPPPPPIIAPPSSQPTRGGISKRGRGGAGSGASSAHHAAQQQQLHQMLLLQHQQQQLQHRNLEIFKYDEREKLNVLLKLRTIFYNVRLSNMFSHKLSPDNNNNNDAITQKSGRKKAHVYRPQPSAIVSLDDVYYSLEADAELLDRFNKNEPIHYDTADEQQQQQQQQKTKDDTDKSSNTMYDANKTESSIKKEEKTSTPESSSSSSTSTPESPKGSSSGTAGKLKKKANVSRELRLLMPDFKPPWATSENHDQNKLNEALYRILKIITEDENAWPFQKPVTKKEAEDYNEIITNPMDLRTMMTKLKTCKYQNKKQFHDDLNLIFSNCYKYNTDPKSIYRECARNLKKKTDALMKTAPDINVTQSVAPAPTTTTDQRSDTETMEVDQPDEEVIIPKQEEESAPSSTAPSSSSSSNLNDQQFDDSPTPEIAKLRRKLDKLDLMRDKDNLWQIATASQRLKQMVYRQEQSRLPFAERDALLRSQEAMESFVRHEHARTSISPLLLPGGETVEDASLLNGEYIELLKTIATSSRPDEKLKTQFLDKDTFFPEYTHLMGSVPRAHFSTCSTMLEGQQPSKGAPESFFIYDISKTSENPTTRTILHNIQIFDRLREHREKKTGVAEQQQPRPQPPAAPLPSSSEVTSSSHALRRGIQTEKDARKVLSCMIALMSANEGFEAVSKIALEMFTDVMESYLMKFGKVLKTYVDMNASVPTGITSNAFSNSVDIAPLSLDNDEDCKEMMFTCLKQMGFGGDLAGAFKQFLPVPSHHGHTTKHHTSGSPMAYYATTNARLAQAERMLAQYKAGILKPPTMTKKGKRKRAPLDGTEAPEDEDDILNVNLMPTTGGATAAAEADGDSAADEEEIDLVTSSLAWGGLEDMGFSFDKIPQGLVATTNPLANVDSSLTTTTITTSSSAPTAPAPQPATITTAAAPAPVPVPALPAKKPKGRPGRPPSKKKKVKKDDNSDYEPDEEELLDEDELDEFIETSTVISSGANKETALRSSKDASSSSFIDDDDDDDFVTSEEDEDMKKKQKKKPGRKPGPKPGRKKAAAAAAEGSSDEAVNIAEKKPKKKLSAATTAGAAAGEETAATTTTTKKKKTTKKAAAAAAAAAVETTTTTTSTTTSGEGGTSTSKKGSAPATEEVVAPTTTKKRAPGKRKKAAAKDEE